jgi:hypothetical protein
LESIQKTGDQFSASGFQSVAAGRRIVHGRGSSRGYDPNRNLEAESWKPGNWKLEVEAGNWKLTPKAESVGGPSPPTLSKKLPTYQLRRHTSWTVRPESALVTR